MEYRDLEDCDYTARRFTELPIAVGWLEGEYTKGKVDEGIVKKLIFILQNSPMRKVYLYRGYHTCTYCGIWAEKIDTAYGKLDVGRENLIIPALDGRLYYCPSMIIHYILDHGYRPPDCFLEAVEKAEVMSLDFIDLVAKTYKFPKSRDYDFFVGEFVATENGLLGEKALHRMVFDIVREVSRRSWPNKCVTREQAADITRRVEPLVEDEKARFSKLLKDYEGTKWMEALEAYPKKYDWTRGLLKRLNQDNGE